MTSHLVDRTGYPVVFLATSLQYCDFPSPWGRGGGWGDLESSPNVIQLVSRSQDLYRFLLLLMFLFGFSLATL